MNNARTSKRVRRKRRPPKKPSYIPVDLAGNPIHVSAFRPRTQLEQRPLTPEEAQRRQAPLNSRNDGFRLLR